MAFPYDPDQAGQDFEALDDTDAAANIEALRQEIEHAPQPPGSGRNPANIKIIQPERPWCVPRARPFAHARYMDAAPASKLPGSALAASSANCGWPRVQFQPPGDLQLTPQHRVLSVLSLDDSP